MIWPSELRGRQDGGTARPSRWASRRGRPSRGSHLRDDRDPGSGRRAPCSTRTNSRAARPRVRRGARSSSRAARSGGRGRVAAQDASRYAMSGTVPCHVRAGYAAAPTLPRPSCAGRPERPCPGDSPRAVAATDRQVRHPRRRRARRVRADCPEQPGTGDSPRVTSAPDVGPASLPLGCAGLRCPEEPWQGTVPWQVRTGQAPGSERPSGAGRAPRPTRPGSDGPQ
jgi:hypothetical protein